VRSGVVGGCSGLGGEGGGGSVLEGERKERGRREEGERKERGEEETREKKRVGVVLVENRG